MDREIPSQEKQPKIKFETEAVFKGMEPEEFLNDPFEYFDTRGTNIKSGEVQYDESGNATEDPTATKDLPDWLDENNIPFGVVGKKVNIEKSQVAKTENPFHEYEVMKIAKEFGLPAAEVVAKISRGSEHLILTKKVEGIRWVDGALQTLLDAGFSPDEVDTLLSEAGEQMTELAEVFASVGISRNWKHKDMIFHVDIPNKKLLGITPTDWERTKIDRDVLEQAREYVQ
jgi:hypothetical protein